MVNSNVHLLVYFELHFQNKTVVFFYQSWPKRNKKRVVNLGDFLIIINFCLSCPFQNLCLHLLLLFRRECRVLSCELRTQGVNKDDKRPLVKRLANYSAHIVGVRNVVERVFAQWTKCAKWLKGTRCKGKCFYCYNCTHNNIRSPMYAMY